MNTFGPNYMGHHWKATVTDRGIGLICERKGCQIIWYPSQSSRDIKWCKGEK